MKREGKGRSKRRHTQKNKSSGSDMVQELSKGDDKQHLKESRTVKIPKLQKNRSENIPECNLS